MDILSLFVLIPVLTVMALLFVDHPHQVRRISAIGMSLQLILSVVLVVSFLLQRQQAGCPDILFQQRWLWFSSLHIYYAVGVDGVSVALILLTSIVVFAGIFASWEVTYRAKEFFISLILLSSGVYGFFISLDLFTMFLFYEIAVIPMYLLIGIWGSGPKEYSAMKLTLMLMGGSALLLAGLLGIATSASAQSGTLTFSLTEISAMHLPLQDQLLYFPLTFLGFGVLGALFPFHTWSPDGHASAPTAVSMLHAGVLMKLGGYGCYKIAISLLPEAAQQLSWIFIILTAISVMYGAMGAIVQKDLKYINAYSSVSHCGLVLFGLLMFNKSAMTGAVLQMVSHGLMCALFFGLIGMIYGRTHTRMIDKMGGLMKIMPFLSMAYVLCGMASLGLPGLSGFAAEMSIFVGAFQHGDVFHRTATILAVASIVATAVYILRAVAQMLLGPVGDEHFRELPDARWQEKLSVVTLMLAIMAMGLAPLWLSDMIGGSVSLVLQKLQ